MSRTQRREIALSTAVLAACFGLVPNGLAQASPGRAPARATPAVSARSASNARPCTTVTNDATTTLTLGKSRVLRLDAPAARIVVGGQPTSRASIPLPVDNAAGAAGAARPQSAQRTSDGVADAEITLLSPTELFILGRRTGSMNVIVQSTDGRCTVKDIVVSADPVTLQAQLREVMPDERAMRVLAADSSLVLTGTVSDSDKLQHVLAIANSYADSKKVINLLRVSAPQQVMLEVKIAEVSKTLLDHLGLDFSRAFTTADGVTTVIQGIIGGGASLLSRTRGGPGIGNGVTSSTQIGIDANKKDGIVRVLAEPTIVAISGQSASFLSGGKIFIPVAQTQTTGVPVMTLEEKEFGVGLKFTPTVLDGRVNLKVVSEVSELTQTGSPFTSIGGQVTILPSMTTRRVDTTVQLGDGQSFVVAGLIKNNVNEALNKFPGLGEAPVLGALFRSSEFQNDQTELMFVVTPHLVKPLQTAVTLPTDVHVTPSRSDVMLMGSGEGSRPAAAPALAGPTAPAQQPAAAAVIERPPAVPAASSTGVSTQHATPITAAPTASPPAVEQAGLAPHASSAEAPAMEHSPGNPAASSPAAPAVDPAAAVPAAEVPAAEVPAASAAPATDLEELDAARAAAAPVPTAPEPEAQAAPVLPSHVEAASLPSVLATMPRDSGAQPEAALPEAAHQL